MNEVKRDYWENGQLRHEYPYVDGNRHGLSRWWHENGQLWCEEPYVDGKQHGLCRYWHENGQLWSIDLYNNGAHVCEWRARGHHSIDITKLSFR